MLVMLDNVANLAGNPNENYARELVELFTMGIDNGYTQADIEDLARCFTGWGVCEVDAASVADPHAPCAPGAGSQLAFLVFGPMADTKLVLLYGGTFRRGFALRLIVIADISLSIDNMLAASGMP